MNNDPVHLFILWNYHIFLGLDIMNNFFEIFKYLK